MKHFRERDAVEFSKRARATGKGCPEYQALAGTMIGSIAELKG
jgi:hypothetical protein